MKKNKAVFYECTWCHLVLPESDERIKRQIERDRALNLSRIVYCPECGSPMVRRVYKQKGGKQSE